MSEPLDRDLAALSEWPPLVVKCANCGVLCAEVDDAKLDWPFRGYMFRHLSGAAIPVFQSEEVPICGVCMHPLAAGGKTPEMHDRLHIYDGRPFAHQEWTMAKLLDHRLRRRLAQRTL